MIRVAICHSNMQESFLLKKLLEQYKESKGDDFVISFFHSTTNLLFNVNDGDYDLFLISAQLNGINGVQTINELRTVDKQAKVVLLVPSPKSLAENYTDDIHGYLVGDITSQKLFPLLDNLISDISDEVGAGMVIKSKGRLIHLAFSKLEFVEVIRKTVCFHLIDDTVYEVTGTLSHFSAQLLSWPDFIQVHRSYIVNLVYVELLENNRILTHQGHSVPVSKYLYPQIRSDYLNHLFDPGLMLPSSQAAPLIDAPINRPLHILLADDTPPSRTHWIEVLQKNGCFVETATNRLMVEQLAQSRHYDCIILDKSLQSDCGFALCEHLHAHFDTPVVFLSATADAADQLRGFQAGAIDYISTEITDELFWLKVSARIQPCGKHIFHYGILSIDCINYRVSIEDSSLVLTPVELNLLWFLAEHIGRVYSPNELYDTLWNVRPKEGVHIIQMHLSRIHHKLEKLYPLHQFIETVPQKGYRFVLPPI